MDPKNITNTPVSTTVSTPPAGAAEDIVSPYESLDASPGSMTVQSQTSPPTQVGEQTVAAAAAPETTSVAKESSRPPVYRNKSRSQFLLRTLAVSVLSFVLLAGAGLLVQQLNKNKGATASNNVAEQGVSLQPDAQANDATLTVDTNTLVVNGNVLTKGSLQVGNGTAVGEILYTNTTGGQQYVLPNSSGTFCLSTNNCNFAQNGTVVTSFAGTSGAIQLQGTPNQITVTNANGTITIGSAQDIAQSSVPTFAGIRLNGTGTQNGNTICDSSNNCGNVGAGAFIQNGNSFGAAALLGTNDAFSLAFETNGTTRLTLDTSGNATLAGGQLLVAAGSTAAPSLSFTTDSDTGITLSGTNQLSVVAGAGEIAQFSQNGIRLGVGGTADAPGYSWTSDTDLGMYRAAADTLGFATSGSERLRISSSGQVGINTSSFGANNLLTVGPGVTADTFATTQLNAYVSTFKPLVVQGAASQTANLQEWQDSTGAVLASVSEAGRLSVNTSNKTARVTIVGNGLSTEGTALSVSSGVTNGNGYKGISVNVSGNTGTPTFGYGIEVNTGNAAAGDIGTLRGISIATPTRSSTGNITAQQALYIDLQYNATWNPNAYAIYQAGSADRSYFAGNVGIGNLAPGNRLSVGTPAVADATAAALIATGGTGNKALVLQGAAGQTANLQEWQTSSGTALGTISATGAVTFQNSTNSTTALRVLNDTGTGSALNVDTTNLRVGINNASSPNRLSVNTATTADSTAQLLLSTASTTAKGIVVQAVASQTANLQEWQNSSGTALASMNASGELTIGSSASSTGAIRLANNQNIGWRNSTNSADITLGLNASNVIEMSGLTALSVGSAASTSTTGVVRLGNTAAINWRNAAGSGNIAGIAVTASDVLQLAAAPTTNDTAATVSLGTTGTAKKGLVVQAVTSQSANLQEWQSSSGTVMAFVSSNGKFSAGNASSAAATTSYDAYNLMINGSTYGAVRAFYSGSGSGGFGGMSLWGYQGGSLIENVRIGVSGAGTQVFAPQSTSIGLVVKGASGQTSNLQEWQNSSGTALASINASGNLSVVNAAVTGTLQVTGASTFSSNITVNGKIITGNSGAGTTTVTVDTTGAGTGATASVSGNDTAGVITVNTGTGTAVGRLATLNFSSSFGATPRVVITPGTVPAGGVYPQYHFTSATGNFELRSFNALTISTTYTFSYHVMQ